LAHSSWVNFWGVTVPAWLDKLLKVEFLFFALFFFAWQGWRRHHTDRVYLSRLNLWAWVEMGLFAVFTVLVYTLQKGFMTPYGLVYLLSLFLAIGVTIRMRETIEAPV
jgi:hypothetical protein